MTQNEIIEMAGQHFCRIEYCNGNVHEGYEFSLEELEDFAKLVAAKEQDRCCAIVFAQCESDNVAQRTVDAIRGKA